MKKINILVSVLLLLCVGIMVINKVFLHNNKDLVLGDKVTYGAGDVNADCKISSLDVILVKKHILNIDTLNNDRFTRADVNNDNVVNSVDYIAIKKLILNGSMENICTTEVSSPKTMEIHFIASGFYDDAIFIKSDKASIFIDGGRGKDAVVKYLKEKNISTIDYVIGSHTEYDHIDAQGEVIKQFDVKNVLYPNDIAKCGCRCDNKDVKNVLSALKSKNMTANVQPVPSKLQIGDMTLYFIAPSRLVCNKNNNSFVFILVYGNNKFMFTGDADSTLNDVNELTTNAQTLGLSNIQVDVLKYPHHGNEYLATRFIDAISAKAYVVPNYHAPKIPVKQVMDNLNAKGITVYRQSDSKTGNILITSDGNNISFNMDV